ncbi:hypothetical protein JT31_11510 [Cedecea neteri]|uniref:Uncharacterized protein n=1 Tax=Cedecea neteri TaxID=158822 RepID=A0A089Q414_9ENTR|nr:hypothetical protein JT31_11510 [Cedecea neteri]
MRIAQRKPGNNGDDKRPQIEPRKRAVLRHRVSFHQTLVAHHADGKADISALHQQQAYPEVIAHFVVANNRRPDNRQSRAQRIAPAQFIAAQQIIDKRDVQRRHHREKQEFGNREVEIGTEAEQVHHAELQRPHQHIQQQGF